MLTKTFINQERAASDEFRSYIIETLKNDELTVTFNKKDGTERVMKCTRNLSKVPSDQQPSGTMELKETSAIRVFDLEANGWRSFNAESVTAIETSSN